MRRSPRLRKEERQHAKKQEQQNAADLVDDRVAH
jgi:hypothetical protein